MVDIKDRAETYEHKQYITVTSDYPVGGFNTNGFTYKTGTSGIDFWDVAAGGSPYAQHSIVPIFGVTSNDIASPTSFQSTTNEFVSWVVLATNDVVTRTNPDSGMGLQPIPFIIPGWDEQYITNTYTNVSSGLTNVITEVLYSFYTNVILDTSYKLDVKELRSLDCFDALSERRTTWVGTSGQGVYDYTYSTTYGSYASNYRPVFFRAAGYPDAPSGVVDSDVSERYNLVNLKENIKKAINPAPASPQPTCYGIIDKNHLDGSNTLDGFLKTNSRVYEAAMSLSDLCDNIGAPTNYFDHTPWRNLNGSGYAIGRVVTNSFIIAGSAAPPTLITNSVKDYLGDTRSAIGTNGQTVTLLSTNTDILAGYTELDYGWGYMTQAIAELEFVWDYYANVSSDVDWDSQYTSNTWSAAKSGINTTITSGGNMLWYGTYGVKRTNPPPTIYTARKEIGTWAPSLTVVTNLPLDAWVYLIGETQSTVNVTTGNTNVYENNGFAILENTQSVYTTASAVTTNALSFTVGTTNSTAIPVWCDEPVTAVGVDGGTAVRGFRMLGLGSPFNDPLTNRPTAVLKYDFDFD